MLGAWYLGGGYEWWLLLIGSLVIGGLAQFYINSTVKRWSRVQATCGLTGAQVAETILNRNGIGNRSAVAGVSAATATATAFGSAPTVGVRQAAGRQLSDHYDPRNRTVTLSAGIYGESSVASTAIAAHEVGHALQHAQGYVWSGLRTTLVPAVNLASTLAWVLIFVGLVIRYSGLYAVGIAFFAVTVLFQIITLPVEINASTRGLAQLRDAGLLTGTEQSAARQVLTAAALTYVASALVSVMYLLYYLGLGGNRRR